MLGIARKHKSASKMKTKLIFFRDNCCHLVMTASRWTFTYGNLLDIGCKSS